MSWLELEALEDILHRVEIARSTLSQLRRLAPDEQREVMIANLERLVAEHDAELDHRRQVAADVIERIGEMV